MIFRARTIVTMDGPPLENGAVAIAGDRIVAVGEFSHVLGQINDTVTDLGEVTLMPGLINAHCHLEFSTLRGKLSPDESFANWIEQINAQRRALTEDDLLAGIAAGFAEAKKWGTTTIANTVSRADLLSRLTSPPLRTWWFLELIDVRATETPDELVARAMSLGEKTRSWPGGGFGLSPHAPFTASARLSRRAAKENVRLTMHLAESREEMEMFRDGRGALFALLQNLGRPMDDCGRGKTPLEIMLERQTLDERWLITHLNELTETDFLRLGRLDMWKHIPPRFHIAHCPRSGKYFSHAPFPLRRLRELGFNICLGTDSLASNSSLSLFAEMQAVRAAHPWLEAAEILKMATTNSAHSLGQENSLGKIAPGFFADLIALPIVRHGPDLLEEIIAWDQPVPWMLRGGICGGAA